MATNMFKKYTESLTREVEVGANVPGGTAVIADGQPAVTIAASGGSTRTITLANGDTLTQSDKGGVGYRENCAVVAFDGTWLFEVEGATDGETVPDSAAGTNRGTAVYRVAADGSLTTTEGSNVFFGIIDDGRIVDGVAPVQIGVPA